MNRRKGTPCACECDPCRGKNSIRAINNVSAEPNGDFFINAGSGIGISEGENSITIINQSAASSFVEGDNIDITPSGDDLVISVSDDINIPGNAVIGGDLTVNGTYYTVHAEHVYTEDDYIIMRDGASTGLGTGDYSGFQVEKYDGVNDGRLVIDNTGTARVGDVGDEEPLLTRDESADLTDGALFKWDAVNYKAINEGTVGSDTKPIKIVNGVATAVTDDLWKKQTPIIDKTYLYCNNYIMIGEKLALCWGYIAIAWSNTVQRFTVNLPVTATSADDLYPILQRAMSDGTWWSEVYLNIEANRRTTTSFDIDVYSNKTGDTGSGYAHYIVLVQTV